MGAKFKHRDLFVIGKQARRPAERRYKRIMKEIPLSNGLNAKVDDEDLEDESLN